MASNDSKAKFEMNITLETYVPNNAHRWRVHGSPTAEEKNEYYKTYDPMTGARIAATLSGFFLAAVLYVVYKSKCKRTKMPRHASLTEQPSIDRQTWPSPWDNLLISAEPFDEENNILDAGQQSPNSNIYYQDDSQMPPWKVYAKELFLYGPGLWRSTSLIGSAPLPNVPGCCSEDYALDNSRGSLAAVSLTGSLMGRLGSRSRQHNMSCGSKSTLQVPSDFDRIRKRSLPMRSVSFRGAEPAYPVDSAHFKRTASLRMNPHRRERSQRKSVSSPASRQSSVSPCVSRQNSSRENQDQSGKKRLTERSTSLYDKSSPGSWRSTFVKIIRAKSTCGNSNSSPGGSTQKFSVQLQTAENQQSTWLTGASYDGSERIDIRVIQATPAVSPCTSIKTLSSESVDGTSVPFTAETKPVPVLLSVQDRRRRFANARMKGQTIDHSDKAAASPENINNSSRIWLEVPTFRRDSMCGSPGKSGPHRGGHPLLRPTRSCERPAGVRPHISRQSSMHIPQMCSTQTK